jgi:hypothetical protein
MADLQSAALATWLQRHNVLVFVSFTKLGLMVKWSCEARKAVPVVAISSRNIGLSPGEHSPPFRRGWKHAAACPNRAAAAVVKNLG